jgi:AraC-like DNA-binding protein
MLRNRVSCRYCCKSLFAGWDSNSPTRRCRCFRAMFGASPKQFARVARIEKILAMRQAGSAWADIAYACGFADQAHMINDFDAIVGETPQRLFRTIALDADRQGNTPIGQSAGLIFPPSLFINATGAST